MQKLSNKVVVITGGTSGIGLATARLFIAEGARVVLFARGEAALAEAARALGPQAHTIAGDVGRADDVARLFRDTHARFGKVSAVIASAARVMLAPLVETSDALLDEIVGTNLRGTFFTVRHAVPVLDAKASIVIVTSWLGQVGFPGSSAVAMTKSALRALTRVAAAELGPRGVRVNALCPGAIETPLWGKLGLPADTLAAAGKAITAQIPLGRWGSADELARAALFLASDESSYVTGTELAADGGLAQV